MPSELFRDGRIDDVLEGSRVYCVDRVITANGTRLLSGGSGDAVLSSVTLKVYGPDESEVFSASPAVSAVLKSALTVDGYWPYDSIGYNWFSFTEPTDFAQVGGAVFRYEYRLVTANFGVDYVNFYKRFVSEISG